MFEGTNRLLAIYKNCWFFSVAKVFRVSPCTLSVQNRVSLATLMSCEGRKSEEALCQAGNRLG